MNAVQLTEVYTRSSSGKDDSQKSKEYKRFIWDVVFRYFALLGVTLVVIGLGEEFFLERGLGCNTPPYVNRDQYTFVVLWCSREVRLIDLLPLLILIQTACILTPQILWEVYADPSLQQFFKLIPKLDRLRNKTKGNYDVDTSRIVSHLTKKYGDKDNLLHHYSIKLMSQNILSFSFVFLMLGLYRGGTVFRVDFVCSQVGSGENLDDFNVSMIEGLDPFNVRCTYTTSEAFFPLWIADVILLMITASFGTFGFVWVTWKRHWEELDHQGKAHFYYSFAMNGGEYNPVTSRRTRFRIKTDLDFLILLLFNSDRGQGETFYEVQVELDLHAKWADDYDKYSKYVAKIIRIHSQPEAIKQELQHLSSAIPTNVSADHFPCHLGDHLVELCTKGVKHWTLYDSTLHLFCGSGGCTLALGKLSKKTYAVDFNPFFVPPSPLKNVSGGNTTIGEDSSKPGPIKEDNFTNVVHLRVPADIISKTGPESAKFARRLKAERGVPIQYDLVVVTCMEPHFRSSTVKVILDALMKVIDENGQQEGNGEQGNGEQGSGEQGGGEQGSANEGSARKDVTGCLIVVCSPKIDHLREVMEDLENFCDHVVLDSTVCHNQENGQYVNYFQTHGGRLPIFLQVAKFNRERYLLGEAETLV